MLPPVLYSMVGHDKLSLLLPISRHFPGGKDSLCLKAMEHY